MIFGNFTDTVTILRRVSTTSASRDIFNNPVYGSPDTWTPVYENIKVRLAFSGKALTFAATGELVKPTGTLYFDKKYDIRNEDRLISVNCPGYAVGIEYVVVSVVPSFILHGIIDHMEGALMLPVI